MGTAPEWVQVVPPMPAAQARRAYEQWKESVDPGCGPPDDDVRMDLVRTASGCLVRYLVCSRYLRPSDHDSRRSGYDDHRHPPA